MNLKYWTGFSKRKNSTKIPTSGGIIVSVVLKEDTTIDNPSIILSGSTLNLDYAYIQDFGKYYFVGSPVILTNGMTQYDLEEDYLATHKAEISSTTAMIAYSSLNYDTWKVDSRLPTKALKTVTKESGSAGIFDGSGSYILALSNVEAGTSFICYYALTQAEMQSFMNEVATDTNLKQSVENYCADVWDAIISCTWIPVKLSEIPGSNASLKVSNYTCNTTGKKISNPPTRASSVTVTIPWTFSDFRRTAPYTTLNAWIPGYGYISMNSSDLIGESSVKFSFMVDCMTGDCCCNIIDAVTSYIYQSVSYNMGISIPISRYTQNAASFVNNTSNFVGNAASLMSSIAANPTAIAGSVVSTISSGVNLCLSANSRDVSTKGTLGGRAVIGNGIDVEIYAFSMDTEDPDATDYIAKWGRPVGRVQAISNHSGYVQCDGASVDIAGDNAERDIINSYLNNGFYYE